MSLLILSLSAIDDQSSINHNLYIFTIIAIIIVFSYIIAHSIYSIQKSKSRYLKQNESVKLERQRISSEIHDELGSGLSALKLYAELASRNRPDVIEIKQLSEMVNEISTKIYDIVWSTSAENDQLNNVIYHIQEQLGKLFMHSSIKFEAELPDDIPFLNIKSEIRRDFYLLTKEIAHNALKHSNANRVKLKIAIVSDMIILSIRDNGDGFDPNAKKNSGMGLSNINQRIKRLNGSLIMEDYKGTKFVIKFPIKGNFNRPI